jgi:poly(A) polymerase
MKLPAAARLTPEALRPLRLAASLHPQPVYLVGGAPRDLLLGRPLGDLDLACLGAQALARKLAASLKGTFVVLDEATKVYRVALPPSPGALRQVDVAELQGAGIEEDLGRRDFTINALALALSPEMPAGVASKAWLDPRGGLADLSARRVRCERDAILKDDPLRLLRAFRIAAQLGFSIEKATLKSISGLRHRVRAPAGERLQAELVLLLAVPGASGWLRLMDEARVLTALLEELEPARQCAEEYYGAGGVLEHSLRVCERADYLMTHLGRVFPEESRAIEETFIRSNAERGTPMRALVMLAALLHDVSKAETAKRVDGRLRFFEHDTLGAKRASAILGRLRFSGEQTQLVSTVIAHHLRTGHLAAGGPVTPRAIYRFFRDLGERALPLLLTCWADHASHLPLPQLEKALKTACLEPGQGKAALVKMRPQEARKTVYHLQVVALLMRRLFDQDRKPVPDRLLDGNEIMKALRLKPGPKVGEWLEKLREAQAEGKIGTRAEALSFLKRRPAP